MAEQTDTRKLLVLHGPALEAQGVLGFFREHFDVRLAEDLDSALAAMRQEPFGAVLAETADFLPLERGVVTQQAAVVLDTLADGVCVVGPRGEMVWANRRLREYPPSVRQRLKELSVRAYEEIAAARREGGSGARRFSLMPQDGRYYEVIYSPVRDTGGVLRQVVAVVVDATSQRRQQMKLNALDRAGRALVQLDRQALQQRDAAQRLRLLEDRIILCSQEVLDYQHFAVLLLDRQTNRLEIVASAGLSPEARRREFFARAEANGICGYVGATGQSYICPDVRKDPRYLPGMDGARSSMTVPLRLHDEVIGVLNVESDRAGAFGEEDRQFAEIFANHVALALHILNLLVFERHTAHTQVSGSICAEVGGALNDIVTTAAELAEDYIGHDDLRQRLSSIIDRAVQARGSIRALAKGPPGVRGGAGASAQTEPLLAGKGVLVADDEEAIRETIRSVLEPCGCRVDLAADGAEAIDLIRRGDYDLVISDIHMPGATGYDVFAAAKERRADSQVVLITGFGYDPDHSIVRANPQGLAAVLFKPFKVRDLLDRCHEALARAGR